MVGRVLWSQKKKRWRRTSLHRNETPKLKKRSAVANERVMVKVWPLHVAQVWRNCRGVECATTQVEGLFERESTVESHQNNDLELQTFLELSAHVAESHDVIIGT